MCNVSFSSHSNMAPPPQDELLMSVSSTLAQAVLEAEGQPASAAKHGFALSKRDGHLLPLVPRNERIKKEQCAPTLRAALDKSPHLTALASDLAFSQPIQGRSQTTVPIHGSIFGNELSTNGSCAAGLVQLSAGSFSDAGKTVQRISSIDKRCTLALVRSLMYLEAGNANQALKDARWAMSHAPQVKITSASTTESAPAPALLLGSSIAEQPASASETGHVSDLRLTGAATAAVHPASGPPASVPASHLPAAPGIEPATPTAAAQLFNQQALVPVPKPAGAVIPAGINAAGANKAPTWQCGWAPACAAAARAYAALDHPAEAVAHMLMAAELDPKCEEYKCDVQNMAAGLSQEQRTALIPANFWVNRNSKSSQEQQVEGTHGSTSNPPLGAAQGASPQEQEVAATRSSPDPNSSMATESSSDAGAGAQQGSSSRSPGDALSRLQDYQEAQRLAALPPIFKPPTEKWQYYKAWMRRRVQRALSLPRTPYMQALAGPPLAASTQPSLALTNSPAVQHDAQVLVQDGEEQSARDVAQPNNLKSSRWNLPDEVMDALLTKVGADDLELLVRHPLGLAAQVAELLCVHNLGGQAALIDHKVEPPSWEEVQALAGLHNLSRTAWLRLGGGESSGAAAEVPQLTASTAAAAAGSLTSEPNASAAVAPALDTVKSGLHPRSAVPQEERGQQQQMQQALGLQQSQQQGSAGQAILEGLPLGWHTGQGDRSDDEGDYDQSEEEEDHEGYDAHEGILDLSGIAGGISGRLCLAAAAHEAVACGSADDAAQLLLQGAGLLLPNTAQCHQLLLPGQQHHPLALEGTKLPTAADSSPWVVAMPSSQGDEKPSAQILGLVSASSPPTFGPSPAPQQTNSLAWHRNTIKHRMVRTELISLAAQVAGLGQKNNSNMQ